MTDAINETFRGGFKEPLCTATVQWREEEEEGGGRMTKS